MSTSYFPEVQFTEPRTFTMEDLMLEEDPEVIEYVDMVMGQNMIKYRRADQIKSHPSLSEAGKRKISTEEDINEYFNLGLEYLNQVLGTDFTSEKVKARLLSLVELNSQFGSGAIERYGAYVADNLIGHVQKYKDGTAAIYVGVRTNGEEIRNLLRICAHEYGHTLGKTLDDLTFEEVKAYAFESLFDRVISGYKLSDYEIPKSGLVPGQAHSVGIHRLGELLRSGVDELSVISHLIGKDIGDKTPDSYRSFSN